MTPLSGQPLSALPPPPPRLPTGALLAQRATTKATNATNATNRIRRRKRRSPPLAEGSSTEGVALTGAASATSVTLPARGSTRDKRRVRSGGKAKGKHKNQVGGRRHARDMEAEQFDVELASAIAQLEALLKAPGR